MAATSARARCWRTRWTHSSAAAHRSRRHGRGSGLRRASSRSAAPDLAEQELRAALAHLRELGADVEAQRALALLEAPRHRPAGLTAREHEVLLLLTEGLTNRQIAERLVVSEHTVHRHVTSILRKLALPSRTAAAAYAVRAGLWCRTTSQNRPYPPREKMAGPGEVAARIRGYRRPGMWALGDYHRFAKELVWEIGPVVVEACGIGPGQRVLDVAAGTGNVAIRAAEAGAAVVASDITPEHFAAGRAEASDRGVELEWVQADAQALPFGDGEFDAVTSSLRRDLRARPAGRRRRAAARVPARRHDRDGQLHARGARGRLLRRLRPLRPGAAAGSAAARRVGQRGARARAVRRPASGRSS